MKTHHWNRSLWAVRFSSPGNKDFLVGETWHAVRAPAYPGEPYRALLFRTRREARAWCEAKVKEWRTRPQTFPGWNARPVRVRETLTR